MKEITNNYDMVLKENLLNIIKENLNNMFVDNYDKVDSARKDVNSYLSDLDIEFQYDYNKFCIDFMNNSINLVDNLTDEQLKYLDTNLFVAEAISSMVKKIIFEKIEDTEKRNTLLFQHELKKYIMMSNNK